MRDFNILLFDQFEMLDAFGPAQIISGLTEEYRLRYLSRCGETVIGRQGIAVSTESIETANADSVWLIPGGMGTRTLVHDDGWIRAITNALQDASYILSVCTGSALLAKAGLLDGHRATSNKKAFEWVCTQGERVNWIRKARWVKDGKYYTSSGISAGIDMTLGFISDIHSNKAARTIAERNEYIWNDNPSNDPFA